MSPPPVSAKRTELSILLATRNQAKAEQIRGLFAGLPLRFSYPDRVAKPPTVLEDGSTHLENAREKAVAWSQAVGGLAVASDGGLVVPALQGAWSSLTTRRAMGEGLDDRQRAERMLELMRPYYGEARRVSFAEALAVARGGTVLGAWQAEGLHGLLAGSFEPAPETPQGFWVTGLWLSPLDGKRYWRLTEAEMEAAEAPWLQLRPRLRRLVEGLLEDKRRGPATR